MINVLEQLPAPREYGNEKYLREYRVFLATLCYVFSNPLVNASKDRIHVLGGGNCEEAVALRCIFPQSEIHVYELAPTPVSLENIALSGATLRRENILDCHIPIYPSDVVIARNAPIAQDTEYKQGINHTTLKVNPSRWVGMLREIIKSTARINAKFLTTYGSLAESGCMSSKLNNPDDFTYEQNPAANLTQLKNDLIGRDGYLLYSKR